VVWDGVQYFVADDSVHGSELWRSDGTAAGTRMVKDMLPGVEGSRPQSLTVAHGAVWFTSATDSSSGSKRKLWRTDGTEAGTRVVTTVGAGGAASYMRLFGSADGSLHVNISGTSSIPDGLRGLWRTDGTAEGTVRLVEHSTEVSGVAEHGGWTYYSAYGSVWRTDGTPAGTTLVHTFTDGVRLIPVDGKLLALDLGTINPGGTRYGGLWHIHADATAELLRPFVSDGTAATSAGDLYFHVTFPAAEAGLWRSDGTAAGTRHLRSLTISGGITEHQGKLHFCANDGIHGEEPWVSDGTAEGTRMLADLTGDSGGSSPTHFTPAGGKLFFAATTEAEGPQLYVMDSGGVPTRYDLWLEAHRAGMEGRTGRGEDADDDGFTNLQEFAFGGNPADAAARPLISSGLAV
ncbi:MAG: hypothetical protein EOP87_24280, partial [Verrucomicrobiaceae bacterium]